jgi:N-acetylglucosamine malate deacetylase 2
MTTALAAPFPHGSGPSAAALPRAGSVLAVTARPGQEAESLGGLVYAYRRVGASVSLLCLTRGEAAAENSASGRLEAIRPWELQLAAAVLGIGEVAVANYRDGKLHQYPLAEIAGRIRQAIRRHSPDLVLVIGPEAIDGGVGDAVVARAAVAACSGAGVPLLARSRPGIPGGWLIDLGADAATARAIQGSAAAAHTSQSEALPSLMRRLDLLDGQEAVRWLQFPQPMPAQPAGKPWPFPDAAAAAL